MSGRVHRTRQEIDRQARYLTFSCFNRLGLFGHDAIKDAFVEQMSVARENTGFRLHAWVIMPEHVHLLITPQLPEFPVARVLQSMKDVFARRVIRRWRDLAAPILPRITDSRGETRSWQRGGGYDRNIFTPEEAEEKIPYMHPNPVRRGLALQAVDWRWSSARWYEGLREGELTIDLLTL